MKLILMTLLLSGLPPWMSRVGACPHMDVGESVEVEAARLAASWNQAPCARVGCRTAVSGGRRPVLSWNVGYGGVRPVVADAVGTRKSRADGRSERAKAAESADEPASERAWLGVAIAGVPPALAEQFQLQGQGVLVDNVVEDSPADRAGFQRHDVILRVGGEPVKGAAADAVDLIKSRRPGDVVELAVLREGREKTLTVTLGSRAEAGGFTWKFETDPRTEIEEHSKVRGKMLMKDGEGHWVFKDLGDLSEHVEGLPIQIRKFVPKGGKTSTEVYVENNEKKIKTKVERDGSTIVVEQEGDGPIAVTRTEQGGQTQTATYENEDELRKADPEAHELWDRINDSVVVHLDVDGIELPDIDLDIDAKEWKDHAEEWAQDWKRHMEDWSQGWKQHVEEWSGEWQKHMEAWKEGKGWPGDMVMPPPMPPLFGDEGTRMGPRSMLMQRLGKPKHTFEVSADGSIEVRMRKGDSEVVQRYANETDLARRSPEMYEKYQKVMASEEDEE